MSSTNPTQTRPPGVLLRKTLPCALAALQILLLGLLASAMSAHAQQSAPTEFGYDPNGRISGITDARSINPL